MPRRKAPQDAALVAEVEAVTARLAVTGRALHHHMQEFQELWQRVSALRVRCIGDDAALATLPKITAWPEISDLPKRSRGRPRRS